MKHYKIKNYFKLTFSKIDTYKALAPSTGTRGHLPGVCQDNFWSYA